MKLLIYALGAEKSTVERRSGVNVGMGMGMREGAGFLKADEDLGCWDFGVVGGASEELEFWGSWHVPM